MKPSPRDIEVRWDERRSKMCSSKWRYPAENLAEFAVRVALNEGAGKFRVYKCEYCRGYHLTSQSSSDR